MSSVDETEHIEMDVETSRKKRGGSIGDSPPSLIRQLMSKYKRKLSGLGSFGGKVCQRW